MQIIVGSTPYCGRERVMPLLEHLGCTVVDEERIAELSATLAVGGHSQPVAELLAAAESPAVLPLEGPEKLSGLESWLPALPDAKLLLLHTRPEHALSEAMAGGRAPNAVLDEWRSAAESMVRAFRLNRTRTLVIDVERALAEPDLFLKACSRKFGLPGTTWNGALPAARAEAEAVYDVIAAQAVAQTNGLADLIGELEASSLPLGSPPEPPRVDCEAAYAHHVTIAQELKDVKAKQRNQAKRAEEAEQQLQAVTEERDRKAKEANAAETELKTVKSKHEEAEQENELLRSQLQQVQQDLESYYLRAQEEANKRAHAEQRAKRKAKKLHQVTQSKSWKLTAPLRAVMRLLSGRPMRYRDRKRVKA